jgi:hypothetical protein
MDLLSIIIPISLISAVWSGRVVLLMARGGFFAEFSARQDLLATTMGVFILPAQIALLIIGFLVFQWWVWLIILAIILLPISALVGRNSFPFFLQIKTVLDLIAIGGTLYSYSMHFELF